MFDVTNADHLLEAALKEIEEALRDPPREPGWVTVREYAASQGLSVQQARRDLELGLTHGKLWKHKIKVDRQYQVVYKPKKVIGC